MKFLITDDSKIMRKILKHAMVKIGFKDSEIVEANDGVETLMVLEQHKFKFDLVLMDINMEGMNGIDALKQIRQNPKSKDLPVIICSSVNDKMQVVEAINLGASDYIVKPFLPEELKEKIDTILKPEES